MSLIIIINAAVIAKVEPNPEKKPLTQK